MKSLLRVFLLILVAFLCSPSPATEMSGELGKPRTRWINYINKKKRLNKFYLKQALLYTENAFVFGEGPIGAYIAQHPDEFGPFGAAHSEKVFEHSEHKLLDLGKVMLVDKMRVVTDSMLYIIAWRKVGDDWLREVDVLLPINDSTQTAPGIDAARSAWIKYANGKDSRQLAQALFTPDGAYLNNSELSRGVADIAKKLAFMSSPGFHINLQSKQVVPVDDQTAIDIGNWITSEFVGYYLIIWKKETGADWKVALYFNF